MPDAEARDAYVAVEVPLPNGKIARGKPIGLKQAREMILLSDDFSAGGNPKDTLLPLLEMFEQATGITEAYLLGLDPDLTMGDLIDVVNRFFYWRRPARPAAPAAPVSPAASGGA